MSHCANVHEILDLSSSTRCTDQADIYPPLSLSQNFPDLPSRVITEMIVRSFQRRRSSLKSTRLSMINLRLKSDQSSAMKGGGRRKKRGRHAIEHRWGMKEKKKKKKKTPQAWFTRSFQYIPENGSLARGRSSSGLDKTISAARAGNLLPGPFASLRWRAQQMAHGRIAVQIPPAADSLDSFLRIERG